MIEIEQCTFAYPGVPPVLSELNLTVPDGAYVAVTGDNGAGKSTLALLVKGLLTPTGGRIVIDGCDTADPDGRRHAMASVGMVFQNPDDTFVATTVERELVFGLENLGISREDMHSRIGETLERFDLAAHRFVDPLALSGGEKQRLALAAIMIMQPRHLVLDEPTSLIDPWNRDHILALIGDAAKAGTTVIHITQHADELHVADYVLDIDSGHITECATLPEPPRISHPSQGHTEDAATVITCAGITHVYDATGPEPHTALSDISLTLERGTALAVLGPSGAGKTTLLEIAAGLMIPTRGEVTFDGAAIRTMTFQFPEHQLFGDTVSEYIAYGLRNIGVSDDDIDDAVDDALMRVGLGPALFRARDPLTLSGGEQRRVAFAGVLGMMPDLLVLDEPTAGLDPDGIAVVVELLRAYVGDGGSLMVSSHDLAVVAVTAHKGLVLDRGACESYGSLEAVWRESALLGNVLERA
jgi:energy-coupling factor transporter ATP-binding protein EcfA2